MKNYLNKENPEVLKKSNQKKLLKIHILDRIENKVKRNQRMRKKQMKKPKYKMNVLNLYYLNKSDQRRY